MKFYLISEKLDTNLPRNGKKKLLDLDSAKRNSSP